MSVLKKLDRLVKQAVKEMLAKYKKVANELRKRIQQGYYSAKEVLPDQKTLALEFETSRVTIKKALDVLYVEGFIYTIQGSGTYIKKNAFQLSESGVKIGQNMGLTHQIDESVELTNEILAFGVRFPNEEESGQLFLKPENPVYEIKRLRILNAKPYSIEYTIIPVEIVSGLTTDILNHSVYDYIQKELGLVFGGNRQTIKAAQPNEYDKKYLNCAVDEPVLEVTKVMFLESGTPFEFSKVRHRFDMVEFSFVNPSSQI